MAYCQYCAGANGIQLAKLNGLNKTWRHKAWPFNSQFHRDSAPWCIICRKWHDNIWQLLHLPRGMEISITWYIENATHSCIQDIIICTGRDAEWNCEVAERATPNGQIAIQPSVTRPQNLYIHVDLTQITTLPHVHFKNYPEVRKSNSIFS